MFGLKIKITKLVSICMVAATLFTIAPVVSAVENNPFATAVSYDEQITPQAEETVWVTRVYNGKKQIRLWSLTRGIWLTDWIDHDF